MQSPEASLSVLCSARPEKRLSMVRMKYLAYSGCRYLKCVGKRENKSHMATVAQNTHPPSLSSQSVPLPAKGMRERTLMKVLLVIEANSGVAAKEGDGGAAMAVDTPSPTLFYATFLLWLLLGLYMTRRV